MTANLEWKKNKQTINDDTALNVAKEKKHKDQFWNEDNDEEIMNEIKCDCSINTVITATQNDKFNQNREFALFEECKVSHINTQHLVK